MKTNYINIDSISHTLYKHAIERFPQLKDIPTVYPPWADIVWEVCTPIAQNMSDKFGPINGLI